MRLRLACLVLGLVGCSRTDTASLIVRRRVAGNSTCRWVWTAAETLADNRALSDRLGKYWLEELHESNPDNAEWHFVAVAGDDVVVAAPADDSGFSGVEVRTRIRGVWDVTRFSVPHSSMIELPVAAALGKSGVTVAYITQASPAKSGAVSVPAALYIRHRPFGGAWSPERLVHRGDDNLPVPIETSDGSFHVFWGESSGDTQVLHHALSRDLTSWADSEVLLPPNTGFDAAAEGDGVRVAMWQSDDVNGLKMTYSRLFTMRWSEGHYSAPDTIRDAKPFGPPTVTRLADDTDIVAWEGEHYITYVDTTRRGKSRSYQAFAPVDMFARDVRVCGTP